MSTRQHPGDLLSAYLDDELPADEARAVEAHLARCGECGAELDDLATARRLVRQLPPVPAPPGVMRGLVEERRRWTRRGAGLALAAAAVSLLAGVALADPPDDGAPREGRPLSLTGDSSRFDTTFGRPPPAGDPTTGSIAGPTTTGAATTGPSTTSTTSTTGPTTTGAGRDAGPDGESDPVTVGDRVDEVATNLLELIGG